MTPANPFQPLPRQHSQTPSTPSIGKGLGLGGSAQPMPLEGVRALTAAENMVVALLDLTDHQMRPPCADRSGAWTSEDPKLRIWAARRCPPCPLAKACHDLAAEIRPSFGVWSGHDWARRPYARRP